MFTSSLLSLIWPVFALLCGGLQITACALMLRERNAGTWLMLAGCAINLVASLATQVFVVLMNMNGGFSRFPAINQWLQAGSMLGGFGWLLFSIGLLLHALNRRGLATRIAELESILADQNKF